MAQWYCSSLLNCRAQALVGSNPAPSATLSVAMVSPLGALSDLS